MERNKRGRGLDKPTRGALSALDALIKTTIEDSRPPDKDEFTVDDYAKGINVTLDAAYNRLRRKVNAGEIVVRKAVVNSTPTNIYRVKG